MAYVQPIAFVLLMLGSGYLFFRKAKEIYQNIRLGHQEDLTDNPPERIKNTLLIALGQKKMFKMTLPAMLHLFVYVAFLVTQIELIEIILDGITGEHRIIGHAVHGTFFYGLYLFVINFIEFLSLFALIATFAFLARRNLLKVPRFVKPEMKGWPKLDGNIILYWEIYLVSMIFLMNGADLAKVYVPGAEMPFILSGNIVAPLLSGLSLETLVVLERIGWWGHIIGVFGFLVYLPYSKHLHIMLAFPNVYFQRLRPQGQMDNMEAVTNEVRTMMDPNADPYAAPDPNAEPVKFGAKDVPDLSWKNILDAYSCTECGRCTANCPANLTGKKLSPRKIMMDTRDRAEEMGRNRKAGITDEKALLGDYITVEELRACTTCNACVEACPISINPLDIIVQLRRDLIMEQSNSPDAWNSMFSNIENNGAPWQFSPMDRDKWKEELV